jgi:AcrR family transcriptional regulator
LGVTSTGPDLLSASNRDLILQAFADCCAARGYEETTVEEVLGRAGVGRESFDSHFASKEDCAVAALNKVISESLATIATLSAPAPAVERRRFEVAALLELMAQRPALARLGFIDARQAGGRQMHNAYASATRVLGLMLERARDPATAAPAPSTAARAALGGIEAIVRREVAAGRAEELPRLAPDFVYAALVPFVGQREALRQAKLAAKPVAEEE